MNSYKYKTPETLKDKVTALWQQHSFYQEAIVLAVDIGLEGIGVHLRQGPHVIHARTLMFEMPDVGRLEGRRQKRAWRHCRLNRAVRMKRLQKLFEKHQLPWADDEAYSSTKPFELRHRAVTGKLASAHAVSNCIRHVVMHRGYEYFTDEGQFPWGEEATLKKACQWLKSSFLGDDEVRDMNAVVEDLEGSPKDREAFDKLFKERVDYSRQHSIEQVIAEHLKEGKTNLRAAARGHNFPRRALEQHLRGIMEKHREFIPDYDAFAAALFLKPKSAKQRDAAIFHYNRKTKEDMKRLWAKKTRKCPYYADFLHLGTGEQTCATNGDVDVRRWKMLEFAATRRVEIDSKTGKGKTAKKKRATHELSAHAIAALVGLIGQKDASGSEARDIVEEDITAALAPSGGSGKPAPKTDSPFNKDFFTHLDDLAKPSATKAKQVSTLCAESARALFELATENGTNFTRQGFNERLQEFYNFRRALTSDAKLYPQVEFLMGHREASKKDAKQHLHGKLRQFFRRYSEELDSKTAPDYFIIETIGDPPRNTRQKQEWVYKRDENRAKREKLRVHDSAVASSARRLQLHDQQRGRCPFTGLDLPNALSPDLQIEHLFPQSKGGLTMDENLVLTFQWVNTLKDDRTPKEFAADPRDAQGRVLAWEGMLEAAKEMKWGSRRKVKDEQGAEIPDPRQCDKKRDIFAFIATAEKTVPDFGNTTRTAQLARQLIDEAARWMGIAGNADAIAERIGTPSGWLSAQARRSWIPRDALGRPANDGVADVKTRDDYRHHLVDAAVLAHIPPREGMNSVQCNGIFWTETQVQTDQITKTVSYRHLTYALPDLGPDMKQLEPLLRPEPEICPVEKHRPRKIGASLGDSTFWKLDEKTGSTFQRTELNAEKIGDAEKLLSTLQMMNIHADKLPNRASLQQWLDVDSQMGKPLRLRDGTPVRNVWKKDGKGSMKSPLGWSGKTDEEGVLRELRILSDKNERLELWIGWDGKKWAYQTRLVPTQSAMKHLQKMFPHGWNRIAPAYMQDKPLKADTHITLRQLVLGSLHPFSKIVRLESGSPAIFEGGTVWHLPLSAEGSIAGRGEPVRWRSWYAVSSLMNGPRVEFKNLLFKERTSSPFSNLKSDNVLKFAVQKADTLGFILGLPPAAEQAELMGLKPTSKNELPPSDTKTDANYLNL